MVSDSLIHEHIHKAIFDLFKCNVLEKLFDIIQHYFRNIDLSNKVYELCGKITWDRAIKKYGVNIVFQSYGFTKYDVKDARDICNTRIEGVI